MSRINAIWFILVILASVSCKTAEIPQAYNYKVSEVQNNPFGCWMEININISDSVLSPTAISGELLSIEKDSVYLLTGDGAVSVTAKKSVVWAALYTHKNQKGNYMALTGVLIAPNIIGAVAVSDYALEMLLMAIPTLIIGFTHAAIESSKQRNVLVYPEKNDINGFINYSRFPAGIPPGIDFRLLYLKKI